MKKEEKNKAEAKQSKSELDKRKEAFGLFEPVVYPVLSREDVCCCLFFYVRIPELERLILNLYNLVNSNTVVGEIRESEAMEEDGCGKSSNDMIRKVSIQPIVERAGNVVMLQMSDKFHEVLHERVNPNLNLCIAVRQPDRGLVAWIDEGVPKIPQCPSIVNMSRIVGRRQEYCLRRSFPLGLDWSQWTVWHVRAGQLRNRFQYYWFTVFGPGFMYHQLINVGAVATLRYESDMGVANLSPNSTTFTNYLVERIFAFQRDDLLPRPIKRRRKNGE